MWAWTWKINQGRSQRTVGKWRNGWAQDKEKRGKMNESRQLSHLASVWIIRYCYSCGASCCALPQAMWKSWMTVKKDSDKLMDFCEGAWKHSEGSCVDACACCLLGDVRDMMCRGCFSAYGFVLVKVTERWCEYVIDLFIYLFFTNESSHSMRGTQRMRYLSRSWLDV